MLKCIKDQEKALIIELMKNQLTQAAFAKRYPVPVTEDYILECLKSAVKQKDDDELWLILTLIFRYELLNNDLLPLLEQILVEDWHTSHEDIASLLQQLHSPTSAQVLFKATTMTFAYLEYDESFAFARKCLWALGDINTIEVREMIKTLANTGNEVIQEHAQEQIRRLKTS